MAEEKHIVEEALPPGRLSPRVFFYVLIIVFCSVYTGFTLFGSWDFLLNKSNTTRLDRAVKTPLYLSPEISESRLVSLPDSWRSHEIASTAWRYEFTAQLITAPEQDLDVYIPQLGDNAQLFVNGVAQPYFGQIYAKPTLHWSVPLVFRVSAKQFGAGKNTLILDVYANEPALGYLNPVYIGPSGGFASHLGAVYSSKRGLAYLLTGLCLLALFVFTVLTGSVNSSFYGVSVGISVSLLGALLPQVVNYPWVSVQWTYAFSLLSFICVMSFLIGLSSMLFNLESRLPRVIHTVNASNVLLIAGYHVIADHAFNVTSFFYFSAAIVLTGGLSLTLMSKRFFSYGEISAGILCTTGVVLMMLGGRDLAVIVGLLPNYSSFYSLHAIAVVGICLCGLVVLRVRQGIREQARYDASLAEALANTRGAISRSPKINSTSSMDGLISRIATSYSHEFKNPLGALLATTVTLRCAMWGPAANVALRRIERSINYINNSLVEQFDFYKALQCSQQSHREIEFPSWLAFVKNYQCCHVIWLCDPSQISAGGTAGARDWLEPMLVNFRSIPSVCLVQQESSQAILHLYLHVNESDYVNGVPFENSSVIRIKPHLLREEMHGKYLYWRYAFT